MIMIDKQFKKNGSEYEFSSPHPFVMLSVVRVKLESTYKKVMMSINGVEASNVEASNIEASNTVKRCFDSVLS
jgi:hypothetical protein